MAYRLFFIICFFCGSMPLRAQYQVLGSATAQSCHCYTLTQAVGGQNGSVWNVHTLDLTQNFDIAFDVFLGCADVNGADGIAFVLQANPTATGIGGGGMGYMGIPNSVGIVVDTYQNGSDGDPAYDHLSININGDVSHNTANNLAGPVQAIFGNDNIENCDWHVLRTTWNAATKQLSVYFGGALRTQATVDLVNTVFGGNPIVYWGMVGSTGGLSNEQKFCARLNASFNTSASNDTTCVGYPVTFAPFIDALIPITAYWWDLGNGVISTSAVPPQQVYVTPGEYIIKLVVTGADGCVSDTAKRTLRIFPPPVINLAVPPTACIRQPFSPQLNVVSSFAPFIQYIWYVDGVVANVTTNPNPTFSITTTGPHTIEVVALTFFQGCSSAKAGGTINILPKPELIPQTTDGCADVPHQFTGVALSSDPTVSQWLWTFSNGATATVQNPAITFTQAGNYGGSLVGVGSNGCRGDTLTFTFKINKATANAGNDTTVAAGQTFLLNGSGNGDSFQWSPAFGLSNAGIRNPSGVLNDDTTYRLTVTTFEGCTATDDVRITIFKGSQVFIPTAFTPNGDGLNDVLRPIYIGIKELKYFNVYNRWGQLVYTTRELGAGWDGRINGKLQPAGNYVYVLYAADPLGQLIKRKGYFMLLR